MQVLGTNVVIDAYVAAIEQRPEASDAIGVGHVANVLASRVVDPDMLEARTLKVDVAAVACP